MYLVEWKQNARNETGRIEVSDWKTAYGYVNQFVNAGESGSIIIGNETGEILLSCVLCLKGDANDGRTDYD